MSANTQLKHFLIIQVPVISFCVERLNVSGSMLNMWSSLVRLTGEGVLQSETQESTTAPDGENASATISQGKI